MKKGAIYARYSSDKQSGDTLKTQIDKCKAYCEQHDILVCEVFTDEAKSGTTEGGRDQYARMVQMAESGLFDTIVAYKYDRIGRSFVETIRTVYELERYYGVQVYSATEPSDPLVRNILLSVSENFSRQLGDRMTDTLKSTASQGFHCGGVAPYGYLSVKQADPIAGTDAKGRSPQHVFYEPHQEQAPVVQRIFQMYADGHSMKKVAHALNADGITAPGGNTWDISAIRYILHNEVYRGWRIWNKTKKIRKPDGKKTYRHRPREEWVIAKGAHPALVDDELWQQVEAMKERKKRHRANGGGDKAAYSPYLLTGLVKCAECGGNFIVHAPRGEKAGRYAYYRCGYHQRRGDTVCANKVSMPKKRLEGAVMQLLQAEILTKETVQQLIEGVQAAWKAPGDDLQDDTKRIKQALRKVERELGNLVQAIKATGFSATLKEELEKAEQRKAGLEKQMADLQQVKPKTDRLPTPREITEALKDLQGLLEHGTPQERKAVLEENIEQILIQPSGDTLLKANPAGLLPMPGLPLEWCRGPGSNRHCRKRQTDFKSVASTNSATPAP